MTLLAFVANRHNLNSIAALTGVLEADPRTQNMALHFIWLDGDLLHKLQALALQTDLMVVALSFATANLPQMADLIRGLRTLNPTPVILAGGPHPSARPEQVLKLGVDIVVIGEGEPVLPGLLERVRSRKALTGLPGIATLDGNHDKKLVREPRPRRVDLNRFPPMGVRHRRFAPIEITRGCPCACTFCQTSFLLGGRMRHRSVDQIVDWTQRAMVQGYDYLRFVTPNAFAFQSEDNGRTVNLNAIEHLLREVNGLMDRERIYFGTFPSEVGPETVSHEAVELVRHFCGNDNLIFGAQSGSDRLLEALHRNHTVADVYRATEIIVAAELTPVVDLIFGLPGEEPEDVTATLQLMEDLVDMGAVLHTHTFMPLPGTPLQDAPPGSVNPELHPLLDRLASQGHLVGQWRKQEDLARQASLGDLYERL
jgi:B12-binding domain/radical SAM domain protein